MPTAVACQGLRWLWPRGSHQPSSSRTLQDASCCSLLLSFLAERTHTSSAPGLQQHSHYHGSAKRRGGHPCLPLPPPATAGQDKQPAALGRQQPAEAPRIANGRRRKLCVCCQACSSCSRHPHFASASKDCAFFPPLLTEVVLLHSPPLSPACPHRVFSCLKGAAAQMQLNSSSIPPTASVPAALCREWCGPQQGLEL